MLGALLAVFDRAFCPDTFKRSDASVWRRACRWLPVARSESMWSGEQSLLLRASLRIRSAGRRRAGSLQRVCVGGRGLEPGEGVSYGGSVGIEITRPGYHLGRIPASKGKTYPVEGLTPEEVRALLAQCSGTASYGPSDSTWRCSVRRSQALTAAVRNLMHPPLHQAPAHWFCSSR